MKWYEKLSDIISWVLNPFCISIAVFSVLIFTSDTSVGLKSITAALVLGFSIVFPFLYLNSLKSHHEIDSLEVNNRTRRKRPLIVTLVSHLIGFIVLRLIHAPDIVSALMFCYMLNTLIILLITFYWKVSVHAAGLAGPLAGLTFYFGSPIFILYPLIIIVGLARVILKRHTPLQVIAGSILGFGCTYLQLEFFKFLQAGL